MSGDPRCGSCGGARTEFLFSNVAIASVRFPEAPRDVWICRDCGGVFLDARMLNGDALARYYRTFVTFEPPGPLAEGHKALRESQVGWIVEHAAAARPIRRVLDVGCGAGYVLELFRRRGCDVRGQDLSETMIAALKDTYGIDGFAGEFDPARVDGPYDLVTCITVLEHLLAPRDMLERCRRVLPEGGLLYVEVPDAARPIWAMLPEHIAFEHLFHWSEGPLGRLLEDMGFEVLAVESVQNTPDSGNPEAVLRVLARAASSFTRRYTQSPYPQQLEVMRAYRRRHEEYVAAFAARLDDIRRRVAGQPMAIYCGGEHTSLLLGRFDFNGFDVACIFDGDPAIAGTRIGHIPIRHRSEIEPGRIRHFLLSTTNHEQEIYGALKRLDPSCQVYGLYATLD